MSLEISETAKMDAEPAAAAAADPIAAAKAEAEEAVALYQSVCGNLVTFRENALLCVARHAALAGVPATTVIYPVPPELDVSDGIEVILKDAEAKGVTKRNVRESTRAALGAEYARESVMLAMRTTLELSLRDGNVEAIKSFAQVYLDVIDKDGKFDPRGSPAAHGLHARVQGEAVPAAGGGGGAVQWPDEEEEKPPPSPRDVRARFQPARLPVHVHAHHAHTLRAQVYAPETTAGPFDEYMMTFLKGALVDFQDDGMYCLTTDIAAAMAKFSCVPGLSISPFSEERMATFMRVRGKKAKKMRRAALQACGVSTGTQYEGFYGDLLKPVLLLIDGIVESPALEEALRTCRRDKIKIIITGRSVHVTTLRL